MAAVARSFIDQSTARELQSWEGLLLKMKCLSWKRHKNLSFPIY